MFGPMPDGMSSRDIDTWMALDELEARSERARKGIIE